MFILLGSQLCFYIAIFKTNTPYEQKYVDASHRHVGHGIPNPWALFGSHTETDSSQDNLKRKGW